jgi:thiamine biosynthesis protein ThiS
MKIRLKLYALLGKYLPGNAVKNEVDMDVAEDTTIVQVLASLNVPEEDCHLVLINGVFVAPSERSAKVLQEGDALAIWPPVAGG